MLGLLVIGGVLISLTVLFQAIAFDFIIRQVQRLEDWLQRASTSWKAILLTIVVLSVSAVLIVHIWFWALFYLWVDALPDLETALYFSTAMFSTAGAEMILPKEWRMLSGIESTNGFLLFGWATAFIFEIVSTVYRKEARRIER